MAQMPTVGGSNSDEQDFGMTADELLSVLFWMYLDFINIDLRLNVYRCREMSLRLYRLESTECSHSPAAQARYMILTLRYGAFHSVSIITGTGMSGRICPVVSFGDPRQYRTLVIYGPGLSY